MPNGLDSVGETVNMAFLIDHYMALRVPQTLYPNIKKKKNSILQITLLMCKIKIN